VPEPVLADERDVVFAMLQWMDETDRDQHCYAAHPNQRFYFWLTDLL
jgi:hypothetical protein